MAATSLPGFGLVKGQKKLIGGLNELFVNRYAVLCLDGQAQKADQHFTLICLG